MNRLEARFQQVLEGKVPPLGLSFLADDVGEFDYPYVIKLDGSLAADPATFIHNNYGAALSWRRAEVHPDGRYVFRLVGFREMAGTALMYCYCVDRETAEPLSGKAAIRSWPDAPALPGPILPPASAWTSTGIVAYVKVDGTGSWGIGLGEAYYIDTGSGVCKVFVASLDGPCDLVEYWGYLKGTNYRHLAPVFERVLVEDGGDDDDDGEEGGDLAHVVDAILQVAEAIDKPRTIT